VADAGELAVGVELIDVTLPVAERTPPSCNRPLTVNVREGRLLTQSPWVRSLGKLGMEVSTEGWRFPVPVTEQMPADSRAQALRKAVEPKPAAEGSPFLPGSNRNTRLKPPPIQ